MTIFQFSKMIPIELKYIFVISSVLLEIACNSFVNSAGDGVSRLKRSPDACAEYYDIKKAHVVHVGKSEALGARLLNSSSGLSSSDCVKRCCQTDHCTVASHDSQGGSNCYLFDCGDIDDFRCELVAYNSYETAILTVSRKELKQQQQQPELKSASVLPPPLESSESLCKVYEFQCKTSKECIAGYDRCNGAYECPDRSDEDKCDEYRQEQFRLASLQRENEIKGHQLEDELRNQNSADGDLDSLWDRGRNRVAPESNTARPPWDFRENKNPGIVEQKSSTLSPTRQPPTAGTQQSTLVLAATATGPPSDRISTTIPIITSSNPYDIQELHIEKSDAFPFSGGFNFSDPSHFVISAVLILGIAFCAGVTVFVFFRWLCNRKPKVTKYRIVDPDAEDFLLGGSYG